MGTLVLEGGAEFTGAMAQPDRAALALKAKGSRVLILPAAAYPDGNHETAAQNGIQWFSEFGEDSAEFLPILDVASANDPKHLIRIKGAGMVFIPGGFPGYLARVLSTKACRNAIRSAYDKGTVLAGSSAGAMVLCQWYVDPRDFRIYPGLGYVRNALVIPHHETRGARWAGDIARLRPDIRIIGIDEETGMIREDENGPWQVMGGGAVTVYGSGGPPVRYVADETFGPGGGE